MLTSCYDITHITCKHMTWLKIKIIDARQPWDVGGEKKRIRKVRPWRFLGSEKFIGYLRVGLRKNWFKSCCCLFRVSHVPSVQFGVGEPRAPVSSALWHFPTKFVQNLEPTYSMKCLLKMSNAIYGVHNSPKNRTKNHYPEYHNGT